jgi:hypothetical protein
LTFRERRGRSFCPPPLSSSFQGTLPGARGPTKSSESVQSVF